jgi:hypothetical protein
MWGGSIQYKTPMLFAQTKDQAEKEKAANTIEDIIET